MVKETHAPMPMCPMAKACQGMMGKRTAGVGPLIGGIILIAIGVLILVEPRLVAWVFAAFLICMGIMVAMMAIFMRRVGRRFESMQ